MEIICYGRHVHHSISIVLMDIVQNLPVDLISLRGLVGCGIIDGLDAVAYGIHYLHHSGKGLLEVLGLDDGRKAYFRNGLRVPYIQTVDCSDDGSADIEKKISNKMLTEIESETIGEMVMEKLKEIDEISYVRFASVYRQFKDINTFLEEITRLMIK